MRAILRWGVVVSCLLLALRGLADGVGTWGTAVQFAGGSGRVVSGVWSGMGMDAASVALRLRVDGVVEDAAVFSYAVDGGGCGTVLGLSDPGGLVVRVGCVEVGTGVGVADGQWHEVVVRWRGVTGELELWVDGEIRFSGAGVGVGEVLPGGGVMMLGQWQGCAGGCLEVGRGLVGAVDAVRFWSEWREGEDFVVVEPEPGLVLWWPMDEGRGGGGVGDGVRDASGWGWDGRMAGGASRVLGQSWPLMVLEGENPVEVECHGAYEEAGVTLMAMPVTISAGYVHSLGLRSDGRVLGWGSDVAGQLHPGAGVTNLDAISAGSRHNLALRDDGRVMAWGDNAWGQLLVPAGLTDCVAVAAGTVHSVALRRDGTVEVWGHPDTLLEPGQVGASNLVAVAAGSVFSLALRSDGRVLAWGRDDYGQLQVPVSATNVTAIAASYRHALAVRGDGRVVGWGWNAQGQLQVPVAATNVVMVAAGYGHSLALRRDGRVLAWGDNTDGQCDVPEGCSNIVAIAAGGRHSLALRGDGEVLAWGWAGDGALEVPESLDAVAAEITMEGVVDTEEPGDYVIRYVAMLGDGSFLEGGREVWVRDTVAPELVLGVEDPLVVLPGDELVLPVGEAMDVCAGDLSDQVSVEGLVDPGQVGEQLLVYSVADLVGNLTVVTQRVWVAAAPEVIRVGARLTGTAGERSVRLEAEVIPNGLAGVAFFRVGEVGGEVSVVGDRELAAGYESEAWQVDLSGLTPGSVLEYQLLVSNQVSEVVGEARQIPVPEDFVPGDTDGDGVVSQEELDAVLLHYWAYLDGLRMTNAVPVGGGVWQFGLTNQTAWELSVEVSTNAVDWEYLVPALPVFQFRDAGGETNAGVRLYRLRWP